MFFWLRAAHRYAELDVMAEEEVWAPVRDLQPFAFVSHAFGNPLHLVLDALRARCPAFSFCCRRWRARLDPAETRARNPETHTAGAL